MHSGKPSPPLPEEEEDEEEAEMIPPRVVLYHETTSRSVPWGIMCGDCDGWMGYGEREGV
jgi:hypothetical protein